MVKASLPIPLVLTVTARRQDPRGTILGRITDVSGGVMPGVRVTATNLATNVGVPVETNENGNYRIPYLLPGAYRITAEREGFRSFLQDGVELRVADQLTLNIRMTPGDIAEQVVVTGETPLLDASTASTGQVIDQRRIVELPLNGGNAFNLTRFTAGVNSYAIPNHATLATAPDVVSRFSINGSGNNNSEFMIDGTPSMYGQNNAYIPPVDMVQEFRVQTATYDARLGHSPGGNINLMLRSGSNAFHGTLYEFHNNRSLEGLSFFERQRLYDAATGPPTREKNDSIHPKHIINRWGGTVGGPLLLPRLYNGRNRTFWIYGYEGLIRPSAAEGNAFYTVPTARERQGDFSQLLSLGQAFQIYDPATIRPAANGRYSRLPLAGNIVPASRIDPLARNLFVYWPEPNSAGTADGRNNYFVRTPTRNWFHNHLSRFDHHFSDKHRIFARYAQTNATNRAGQVFPSPTIGEDQVRGHKGLGLDSVYVFSPTFLLNVRYGLSRYTYWRVPRAAGFDFLAAGFSRDLVSRLEPQAITFPYLAVDALTPLGTNSPSGNFTNYHVWSADLTNIRGNHSLRYGGEFRLFRESNYSFANQVPRINFDSTWTNGPLDNSPGAPMGQGMAFFLLGIPSSGQITVNPSSADQSTYTAFYLRDDWKVTSRLTVNLGLRYEYESVCRRDWAEGVRATVQAPVDPGLKQEIVCHQRTGRSYEKVYYVDTQGNHSPDNAVCVGRLGTRPWQDGGRNSAGRGNH